MKYFSLLLSIGLLHGFTSTRISAEDLYFEQPVRAIFKAHCFQCHGEEGKPKGKLDLRLRRFMARGGESGPALVAGKATESLLLQRIKSGEMPPGDKKLSPAEIRLIETWINQGARTQRDEPESLQADFISSEEFLDML